MPRTAHYLYHATSSTSFRSIHWLFQIKCYVQNFSTKWPYAACVTSLFSSIFFLLGKLAFLHCCLPTSLCPSMLAIYIRKILFCVLVCFTAYNLLSHTLFHWLPQQIYEASTWIIATRHWTLYFHSCPPQILPPHCCQRNLSGRTNLSISLPGLKYFSGFLCW